ncbi:CHAT domain-containing protein [Streptomyces sp. VRA16 Mangrove soil]|uniref:CHAT domain-containing protein n=1 Tax=Streptomyces sp. VRA16 Mangrove soil TaxID=2817434 RepID=UPI001A9D686C|nr:CHAT domain-containing protein [Streptomyces sp. VRA16 Mangrove soil]MBO1334968.1 CHAT domain-containing protein [Streptomyces sp. VRA16 Mangrove soil]
MTTLQVRVSEPRPGRTQYSYELRSGNGSLVGPLEQEHTVPVSQDLVKGLCKEIDETVKYADPQDANGLRDELVRLGGQLYDALFPHTGRLDLVRRLREATGPLLVQSNESLVPWELLHDEEDFLGLSHDIGRRAKVDGPVVDGRSSDRIGRALIVGDTIGDLAEAREEIARISEWLGERGVECTVLRGAEATMTRVVGELADKTAPYDLFHYSGHVSGEPDAAGLLVHDRKVIGLDALQPLARRGAPPIVFVNGCASASGLATLDSGSRALAQAAQTMNACMSFMMMGAKTVVGTRTPVGDASALKFAEAFYGQLSEQTEAGAAVRGARAELAGEGDATWASFVLYGDPSVRITAKAAVPTPTPSPDESRQQLRYSPQALELLRTARRFGRMRGLVTSVDLLTALLDTDEVRERAAVRIGSRRLQQLTALLREVQGHAPAGAGRHSGDSGDSGEWHPVVDMPTGTNGSTGATGATGATGTNGSTGATGATGATGSLGAATSTRTDGASVNGASVQSGTGRVAFSDTIARVIEGADAAAVADGRDTVEVDDIAVAFLDTGGGNCGELLRLFGVRPERLLSPTAASAERADSDDRRLDLSALGPGAAAAVRSARLLAATGERRISTSLLLQAFAVAGSEVLRGALAEQGEEGLAAYRRMARLGRPRPSEFYARTRDKLERLTAQATENGALVGEEALLAELLADEDSTARKMLIKLGVEPELLIQALRDDRDSP